VAEKPVGLLQHATPVEHAGKTEFMTQKQGLPDREGRNQQSVLVDDVDAEFLDALRSRMVATQAVDVDRSGVGLKQPGEDLDDRRLAGAVLADEAVDLAATPKVLTMPRIESATGCSAVGMESPVRRVAASFCRAGLSCSSPHEAGTSGDTSRYWFRNLVAVSGALAFVMSTAGT